MMPAVLRFSGFGEDKTTTTYPVSSTSSKRVVIYETSAGALELEHLEGLETSDFKDLGSNTLATIVIKAKPVSNRLVNEIYVQPHNHSLYISSSHPETDERHLFELPIAESGYRNRMYMVPGNEVCLAGTQATFSLVIDPREAEQAQVASSIPAPIQTLIAVGETDQQPEATVSENGQLIAGTGGKTGAFLAIRKPGLTPQVSASASLGKVEETPHVSRFGNVLSSEASVTGSPPYATAEDSASPTRSKSSNGTSAESQVQSRVNLEAERIDLDGTSAEINAEDTMRSPEPDGSLQPNPRATTIQDFPSSAEKVKSSPSPTFVPEISTGAQDSAEIGKETTFRQDQSNAKRKLDDHDDDLISPTVAKKKMITYQKGKPKGKAKAKFEVRGLGAGSSDLSGAPGEVESQKQSMNTEKPTPSSKVTTADAESPTATELRSISRRGLRSAAASRTSIREISSPSVDVSPVQSKLSTPSAGVFAGDAQVSHHQERPSVSFSFSAILETSALRKFVERHARITEKLDADYVCVGKGELKRSPKVLFAVAQGKLVLSDAWLVHSSKEDRLLDPLSFLASDPIGERKAAVDPDWSAGKGRQDLLKGMTMYITPSLRKLYEEKKTYADIKKLAQLIGAKVVSGPALEQAIGNDVVTLGTGKSDADVVAMVEKGAKCFDREWLPLTVLRGKLDLEDEELSIEPTQELKLQKSKSRRGRK